MRNVREEERTFYRALPPRGSRISPLLVEPAA